MVDADWVRSPSGRRILVHWADPRPAWLWSGDGATLIWRNSAARYFNARLKKSGPRLGDDPVPIKGQVARLIRLGSPGRSSLSRIQFLAGGKPLSTTCSVTPVILHDATTAALIVAVDPLEPELAALAAETEDSAPHALLPAGMPFLLTDPEGRIVDGVRQIAEQVGSHVAAEAESLRVDGQHAAITRLKASPQGHQLLLLEDVPAAIESIRAEEGIAAEADLPGATADEPPLPMDLPSFEAMPTPDTGAESTSVEETDARPLSSLFDRLADHDPLYGELSVADEVFAGQSPAPPAEPAQPSGLDGPPAIAAEPASEDVIAALIAFEDDLTGDPPVLFRVTGRGFTPAHDGTAPQLPPAETMPPDAAPLPVDPETVERVSRYNFDELSRILTDRVGSEPAAVEPPPSPLLPVEAAVEAEVAAEPPKASPPLPAAVAEGALINIAAETFVLNRLPLGILVFRDQQVLFANRTLTDLVGHETVDGLRRAGIASIFPGDGNAGAGPVTHLVRRDGTPFPVTARLQSITWHGRPALMLSAGALEPRIGHEIAVRGFAETLAEARDDGFITADRSGKVTAASARARLLLGREDDISGATLASLLEPGEIGALRDFLERPARFAETARPGIVLKAAGRARILLFAEGQAGIVNGYFGFVANEPVAPQTDETDGEEADPSMLARISRGVRRPLNSIIGFADLIRSASFGTADNHRNLEYARDIKTAGLEIAVLIDELDDYSRLKAGKYAARPADLDLAALLDSCMLRVRAQANAARVLVRSAISERLPHIRADRASLGQAILNLLASAIDQTPPGGQVILSAQPDMAGGITVNIRDSGTGKSDPGEHFIVFRDGVGKDGEALAPVRSTVGLALTRSLVTVNACTLSVDPAGLTGTMFSLAIPADLIAVAS